MSGNEEVDMQISRVGSFTLGWGESLT